MDILKLIKKTNNKPVTKKELKSYREALERELEEQERDSEARKPGPEFYERRYTI